MKIRLSSILLLFVLSGPLSISLLWLNFQKTQLQNSFESRFEESEEKSNLLTLSFTREESQTLLEWEHEREFEYQGEMYDVLEIKEDGDQIHYLVWRDQEETKIKKQLSELWEEEGTEKEQQLAVFTLFFQAFPSLIPNPFSQEIDTSYSSIFSLAIPTPWLSNPFSPPDFLS
ncbi:hypothetical protein [Algoriphagus algorifonticola]|uniref:hypothetical protein n=1 Tax=Algoriphagus algorifonticola TaxID=2593007 RepID=UPI0011A3C0DC|nr:hypothetical protein [Algoriphagus algorifonticola]